MGCQDNRACINFCPQVSCTPKLNDKFGEPVETFRRSLGRLETQSNLLTKEIGNGLQKLNPVLTLTCNSSNCIALYHLMRYLIASSVNPVPDRLTFLLRGTVLCFSPQVLSILGNRCSNSRPCSLVSCPDE